MSFKDIPASAIADFPREGTEGRDSSLRQQLENLLIKMGFHLKDKKEKVSPPPDPAKQIIMQIEDAEVRSIVKLLHYRTPKGLKAMRDACQKCFILPDDCPYVDYSIFDVKKAGKQLKHYPPHIWEEVISELAKVNSELAGHLRESLS